MGGFAAGCLLWLCMCSAVAGRGGRSTRELRFPEGGSLVGPTDGLAHVLEFDLGFPFPKEFAIGRAEAPSKTAKTWKTKTKRRPKRTPVDQGRGLLSRLEDAVDRLGLEGSSCVSRLRCELRRVSPENSLAEELLAAFLEPADDEECDAKPTACPVSLLQVALHSQQMDSARG